MTLTHYHNDILNIHSWHVDCNIAISSTQKSAESSSIPRAKPLRCCLNVSSAAFSCWSSLRECRKTNYVAAAGPLLCSVYIDTVRRHTTDGLQIIWKRIIRILKSMWFLQRSRLLYECVSHVVDTCLHTDPVTSSSPNTVALFPCGLLDTTF